MPGARPPKAAKAAAFAWTIAAVRSVFERLFAEHGLPEAIRCDNGPPFGSDGAGGLTRLSAWWVKLGICPHFIRPSCPQDNGRHERMHRELKKYTSKPAAATLAEQQGIGVRLVTDFDVQGIQPTMVYASEEFLKSDPDAAKGVAFGYMKAVRAIMERGFSDPEILPIIASYTGLPEELITESVAPLFTVDGSINVDGLNTLQSFFRSMGELNYDTDIDPNTMIDRTALDAALQELDSSQ